MNLACGFHEYKELCHLRRFDSPHTESGDDEQLERYEAVLEALKPPDPETSAAAERHANYLEDKREIAVWYTLRKQYDLTDKKTLGATDATRGGPVTSALLGAFVAGAAAASVAAVFVLQGWN